MESKTKHRILGILVLAGLIVILLPFFQSGKELTTDAAPVKTPPFPDQSIQVTSTPTNQIPLTTTDAEEIKQQPDEAIKSTPIPPKPENVPTLSAPVENKQTTKPLHSTNEKPSAAEKTSLQQSDSSTGNKATETKIAPKAAVLETATPKKLKKLTASKSNKKIKNTVNIHGPVDDNGLFKLQSSAWVIQVGSFKNKANALRVVNNLRGKGYRAFIQQVSATDGDNIRVFVGPENKQSRARELAQTLESDMHLQGIVISYKPLAL